MFVIIIKIKNQLKTSILATNLAFYVLVGVRPDKKEKMEFC